MKFKNKKTGAIVVTTVETIEKLYAKKADYEQVKEEGEKELKVAEIKAKLKELNIEFDDKAKKDELLALLPQE